MSMFDEFKKDLDALSERIRTKELQLVIREQELAIKERKVFGEMDSAKRKKAKLDAEIRRIDEVVKLKIEWCAKHGIMFVGEVQ